jgi:L-ascorbate metabolism protein UlaG (beta-lactamase superfamily)
MSALTWLGHSCFELKLKNEETFLLDPWLDNPKAPAGYRPERLDGILLSHGHFDHIASVMGLAAEYGCPVAGIYDLISWLETKGVKNGLGMNKGGTAQVGSLRVTLTHAFHSSSFVDEGKFVPLGEACGLILTPPEGPVIYFAGDTDVFGDMRLLAEIYQPQVAILPIGDLYTMGPRQAAVACRLLRAPKVIPMHYGTFPPLTGTPEALAELIQDLPGVNVLKPAVGEVLVF